MVDIGIDLHATDDSVHCVQCNDTTETTQKQGQFTGQGLYSSDIDYD